jgi:hypothetical protein
MLGPSRRAGRGPGLSESSAIRIRNCTAKSGPVGDFVPKPRGGAGTGPVAVTPKALPSSGLRIARCPGRGCGPAGRCAGEPRAVRRANPSPRAEWTQGPAPSEPERPPSVRHGATLYGKGGRSGAGMPGLVATCDRIDRERLSSSGIGARAFSGSAAGCGAASPPRAARGREAGPQTDPRPPCRHAKPHAGRSPAAASASASSSLRRP